MKICMITSFFGRHSFGGDSVYIERLSRALLRRGHEVRVVYSSGAFELVRGPQPQRNYEAPPELFIHDIGAGIRGKIAALWNHQTGGLGLRLQPLGAWLENHSFELIHLHNVSLLGGRALPSMLMRQAQAVKFVTAHDYWWICPQNLLWKYGRRVCDACDCKSCVLISRRPPQLWRRREWFNRALSLTDAVLFPSRFAMELYRSRGLRHPKQYVLPGLLAGDWRAALHPEDASTGGPLRPYFACAGRLVLEKGFQTLIPLMRQFPDMDLRIAGSGPAEGVLKRLAHRLPNVKFEGLLNHDQLHLLFLHARAILVPSLFPETFGLVAAEAMSLGIPVIARNRGALPELIAAASGGWLFEGEDQLGERMRSIASGENLAGRPSRQAPAPIPSVWFEEDHTEAYLRLYATLRRRAETE